MAAKAEGQQTTHTVVMISPDQFGFNPQTAQTNAFQKRTDDETQDRNNALSEFWEMVSTLKENGITVLVLPSRDDVVTPDAVFPNNWFSHQPGTLVIYPMLAPNRRDERQVGNLTNLLATIGVEPEIVDLSGDEKEGNILEGTGSLVLDRANKVAFAMESPRTTKEEFDKWCSQMGYRGVWFHAYDANDLPIYHTNVVMSVGDGFAVASLETIKDRVEKEMLEKELTANGRELINITREQLNSFCGNILQLKNSQGESKIIMSEAAKAAFTQEQLDTLSKYGDIVAVNIPTIETVGGGSARCMLAEIFPGDL